MIWVRRVIAIPLIIIFLFLLAAALVITQVNDSAGNADFYTGQLEQADIYNFVYDEVMPVALDEVEVDNPSDLPINIDELKDDIVSAARKILPPAWLQAQVEAVVDEVFPYIVGGSEQFSYTFGLKDRVLLAADVIKTDILHGDAFDDIYDDSMSYLAAKLFESVGELPPVVVLTQQDLEDSLRSTLTQPWVVSQLEAAIDAMVPYVTGDSNGFTITIRLQDAYTDEALLELMGPGNEIFLAEARAWIADGWTFTEADLLADMESESRQTLDDVRGWIASGYTVTEADLRDAMGEDGFNTFDDARGWVDTGRSWLWALWLLPFIILIGIGFLGGRGWKTRAAWALTVLFITALGLYIAAMVGYSSAAEPNLSDILDPSEYEGVGMVMAEKGNEMIENIGSTVAAGLEAKALNMVIASVVGLVGVIVWWVVGMRLGPRPSRARLIEP